MASGSCKEAEKNFEKLAKVAGFDPKEIHQLQTDHERRQTLLSRASALVTQEMRRLWKDRKLTVRLSGIPGTGPRQSSSRRSFAPRHWCGATPRRSRGMAPSVRSPRIESALASEAALISVMISTNHALDLVPSD
jgi:hypothetical protein